MRSTEEVKSIKALSSDVLVKIKFGNFLNPLDQEVPTMKKYKSQRNSTKGIDNFMENVALDSINSSLSSEGCFEQYLEERGIILKDSENGVMMEYISKSGSLSESTARYFFKQLIKAIIIKNKTEETHREIKPEEIILDSEFNLKLAYRNFSSKKECGYKINNALSYKAPEVLAGVEYEPKQVDLFSAAVFLFMMVTQRLPFIKAEPDDKYYSFIIIKDFNGFWAYHTLQCPEIAHLSEEFKDLFCKMVVVNGNERLKIKKVRKHAWYKQELPKHQEILEIFICRNLVIEGDLNADDVPEETRITNIQKSEKSDIESSPGETKEILEAMKNMPTKYTPYYDCDDGDSLMHEVIEFAKLKKYSSKICEEYFRVIFQIKKDSKLTIIQANTLKIPNHEKRCIECICIEGDEDVFLEAFECLDLHIFRNRHAIETPVS